MDQNVQERRESSLQIAFGVFLSSTTLIFAFATCVTYYQFSALLAFLKLDPKALYSFTDVSILAMDIFAYTLAMTSSWLSVLLFAVIAFLVWNRRHSSFYYYHHIWLKRGLTITLVLVLGVLGFNYVDAARRYFSIDTVFANLSLLVSPKVCAQGDQDLQIALWRSSDNVIVACPKSRDLIVLSHGQDVVFSFFPFHREGFEPAVLAERLRSVRTGAIFEQPTMKANLEVLRKEFTRRYGRIDKPSGTLSEQEFRLLMFNMMVDADWIDHQQLDPDAILASFFDRSSIKPKGVSGPLGTEPLGQIDRPAPVAASAAFVEAIGKAIDRQLRQQWEYLSENAPLNGKTVLRLRLNRDGSLAHVPTLVSQSGMEGLSAKQRQTHLARAMAAASKAAPFGLPSEFYSLWKEVTVTIGDYRGTESPGRSGAAVTP